MALNTWKLIEKKQNVLLFEALIKSNIPIKHKDNNLNNKIKKLSQKQFEALNILVMHEFKYISIDDRATPNELYLLAIKNGNKPLNNILHKRRMNHHWRKFKKEVMRIKNQLLIIMIGLLLSGCALGKEVSTEKTLDSKKTQFTSVKSDTSKIETVNKGIKDVVTVEVPVSDPAVDAKIDEILSKLNTQKNSGSNSYRLSYDKEKRQIVSETEVGETKDSELVSSNSSVEEKSFEQTVTENTKKVIKMIPWWGWIVIAWLLRKQIIGIIGIFIPGVKAIHTISDLLNPPNKT